MEWGRALLFQANYNASRSRLDQALTLARAEHLREVEAHGLWMVGVGLWQQGDHVDGRVCLEQSLRIYQEIGDRQHETLVCLLLGHADLWQGDYEKARIYYEQTVAAFREIGDRWTEGYAYLLPARIHHALGDNDGARAYCEECLRICREVRDRRCEGRVLAQLSLLSHHLGDDETAREYAQQALRIARNQDRPHEGSWLIFLGHALAGLARLDEANDIYGQALALLRELGQSPWAMEALAGLARVCLAQAHLQQAQAHVDEIPDYLETGSLDGTHEPFRVYLTCYQVLRANDDLRADTILQEADRLLQERAAKISDEEERRSFLENVAANREIAGEYALVGSMLTGSTLGRAGPGTKDE